LRTKYSKTEIKNIYMNNTNYKASKILGISPATLNTYLGEHGIKKKGRGNRGGNRKLEIN